MTEQEKMQATNMIKRVLQVLKESKSIKEAEHYLCREPDELGAMSRKAFKKRQKKEVMG